MARRIMLSLGLVVAATLTVPSARAEFIFAPPKAPVQEGGTTGTPFGHDDGGHDRFQQVYNMQNILPGQSLPLSPVLITQIAFRPDVTTHALPVSYTMPDVVISLSTTKVSPINDPTNPNHLSSNFTSNLGGDNTVVFSGSLTLSSSGSPKLPGSFDFVITLSTPFFYDPSKGNLLLDIQNLEDKIQGGAPLLDAMSTNGFTLSSVFGDADPGQPLTSGDAPTAVGIDTRFTATPVPEPAGFVLLGTGCFGLVVLARRGRLSCAV